MTVPHERQGLYVNGKKSGEENGLAIAERWKSEQARSRPSAQEARKQDREARKDQLRARHFFSECEATTGWRRRLNQWLLRWAGLRLVSRRTRSICGCPNLQWRVALAAPIIKFKPRILPENEYGDLQTQAQAETAAEADLPVS